MIRTLFFVGLITTLCGACSSDASDNDGGAGSGNTGCPDLSGSWNIANHCHDDLIGMTLEVTQNACKLSFAEPFTGFSGSVTADGKITVSGQQSCSGNATESGILMLCTDMNSTADCLVELQR
jgi:hypothetical protein